MKNIVIIGCGSGIGLATAKQLQNEAQIIGISEAETIAIMRTELKRSSFNLWRKRVNSGISQKHLKKRNPEIERFKCTRQKTISLNKISKR